MCLIPYIEESITKLISLTRVQESTYGKSNNIQSHNIGSGIYNCTDADQLDIQAAVDGWYPSDTAVY